MGNEEFSSLRIVSEDVGESYVIVNDIEANKRENQVGNCRKNDNSEIVNWDELNFAQKRRYEEYMKIEDIKERKRVIGSDIQMLCSTHGFDICKIGKPHSPYCGLDYDILVHFGFLETDKCMHEEEFIPPERYLPLIKCRNIYKKHEGCTELTSDDPYNFYH